jgi:hypothetical protein
LPNGIRVRTNPADKPRRDKRLAVVERMVQLSKKKRSGKLVPPELDRAAREIASTNRETDGLVYELYGITEEGRKIVERGR